MSPSAWGGGGTKAASFNVQPWADGGHLHAGYLQPDENGNATDDKTFTVYQDGVKVAESTWATATLENVPDGPLRYKLDLKASRDAATYRFSPRTHTVWDVVSPGLSKGLDSVDLMPVLQAEYDVRTDLAGYTRGGTQAVRF